MKRVKHSFDASQQVTKPRFITAHHQQNSRAWCGNGVMNRYQKIQITIVSKSDHAHHPLYRNGILYEEYLPFKNIEGITQHHYYDTLLHLHNTSRWKWLGLLNWGVVLIHINETPHKGASTLCHGAECNKMQPCRTANGENNVNVNVRLRQGFCMSQHENSFG